MFMYKFTIFRKNKMPAATEWRTLKITAFQRQLDFINWHYFLPEEGTLVPKPADDASLISY